MLTEKHEFELFPDYYQFYLQDEQTTDGLADAWTDQASEDLFAIALGTIGISTVSHMYDVPVTAEIHTSAPDDDLDRWDHIIECNIDIPSGKIVVAGCTDYFPDAARISVEPGMYQVRVFYGELASSRGRDQYKPDSPKGNDQYKVVLWPGESIDPKVIKRYIKD
jgi:hypothetical protein